MRPLCAIRMVIVLKNRAAIYQREAAEMLHNISLYPGLTEEQLCRFFPEKEATAKTLLAHKEKQNTDPILSEGESVRTKVRDNIELDLLCHNQPENAPVMQEIYELVVETIQLRSPVLRLGNNLFPMALVRERLLQLTSEHIRFVLDGLRNLHTDVKNLKKYLLTMLFNAPVTLNGRTMLDVRKSVNSGFRTMLA